MAENGQNGAAGRDGRDADPTALTTDALEREILHLRELIEARLTQIEDTFNASQASNTKAVEAALAATDKAIIELDSSITRRLQSVVELTESKFITYRTLLDSQSEKVALALTASDKAVTKAEVYNNKQFETMNEKIDDLKLYQSSAQGTGAGRSQFYGWIVAGVGVAATIISIVIVLANVLTAR